MVALDDVCAETLTVGNVRVDIFRASGKGGQHRNKVETAVRLTDFDTGIVVTATEERSKAQNLTTAWNRLEQARQARAATAHHARVNSSRSAQFGGYRSFTWTGWRDEVRSSDGSRASMRRALAGNLGPLLSPHAS